MKIANNRAGETSVKRQIEVRPSGQARQFELGGKSVTFVPLTIRRRHVRKLIVPPDGTNVATTATSFDLPLIRTLGKAFFWQKLLDNREVSNATELARRFRLEPGWVSEVLRMTCLAPYIIQAVLSGCQPRHLNLHALRGREVNVPLNWEEQRRLFEFVSNPS